MIFGIIVNTKMRDCCFGWTCRDKACLLFHDNIDAVLKSQVPIWEFMKCLHVECGIDYPALTAYEKQFGPVDIYRGNRGER